MTDAAALPLPGDGSFAPRTRRREEQRALRNTRRVKRLRIHRKRDQIVAVEPLAITDQRSTLEKQAAE